MRKAAYMERVKKARGGARMRGGERIGQEGMGDALLHQVRDRGLQLRGSMRRVQALAYHAPGMRINKTRR